MYIYIYIYIYIYTHIYIIRRLTYVLLEVKRNLVFTLKSILLFQICATPADLE